MKMAVTTALLAILLTANAWEASAQVTKPDGSRLSESDVCYVIIRGQGDQAAPMGVTRQTVKATTIDGAPAWDVVVHQKAGDRFDMRDHFVLKTSDLRPITLNTLFMGHDHAQLRYGDSNVQGHKIGKDGKTTDIDIPVTGAVWEGNLFGLTVAALPLADGASFSMPKYQYDSGLGRFDVKVVGSETVATPAGPVEAWTVELLALPEMQGGPAMTYQISKSDHRELGYYSPMGGQTLGGDCSGLD